MIYEQSFTLHRVSAIIYIPPVSALWFVWTMGLRKHFAVVVCASKRVFALNYGSWISC